MGPRLTIEPVRVGPSMSAGLRARRSLGWRRTQLGQHGLEELLALLERSFIVGDFGLVDLLAHAAEFLTQDFLEHGRGFGAHIELHVPYCAPGQQPAPRYPER